MNLEEAMVTALEYENKVRDHYAFAAEVCDDPKGKAFFETMTRDEQGHVEYLTAKLAEWRETGKLAVSVLETAIPSREWIEKGLKTLTDSAKSRDYTESMERLFTALKLENEVSAYYRGLVKTIGPDGEQMFKRFLEIEDGHTAIVQAEIDVLQRTGYFYDFMEFGMDGG